MCFILQHLRLCWISKQSHRTKQIQWLGHNQISIQDFDVIQDWRRTTTTEHHPTSARLSSPIFNTRASSQKHEEDYTLSYFKAFQVAFKFLKRQGKDWKIKKIVFICLSYVAFLTFTLQRMLKAPPLKSWVLHLLVL